MKNANQTIEKKFIIIDNTANSGKDYISDDGSNCELIENAKEFSSEKEATDFAKSLTGNGEWFSVVEKSEDNA